MESAAKRRAKIIPAKQVFAELREQPGYQEAYDALEDEFAMLEELMKVRARAKLTQAEIAERMKTTQSAVARLESGAHRASLSSLRRYAEATGHRLRISFEPLSKPAIRPSTAAE
jgi:DNA-binding transcriptional regulator YiaG